MGYEVFEPGQVDAFINLLWSIGFSFAALAFSVSVLIYVVWWVPRKIRREREEIRRVREYAFRPYGCGYQPDPHGKHPGPPPQGGSGVPRNPDGYTSGP